MPAHLTIVITVNEIDLYNVAIFNNGYSKHYTNLTYKYSFYILLILL